MKYAVTYSVSATVTVEVDAVDDIDAEDKADLIPLDVEKLENITADICKVECVESEHKEDCLELVKCMDCGWIGITEELESDGSLSNPYCPQCGSWENVLQFDPYMLLSPRDVVQLWDIFCSMVELSPTHKTVCGFYIFPAGTALSEVEEWFEGHYEGGLLSLDAAINRK